MRDRFANALQRRLRAATISHFQSEEGNSDYADQKVKGHELGDVVFHFSWMNSVSGEASFARILTIMHRIYDKSNFICKLLQIFSNTIITKENPFPTHEKGRTPEQEYALEGEFF